MRYIYLPILLQEDDEVIFRRGFVSGGTTHGGSSVFLGESYLNNIPNFTIRSNTLFNNAAELFGFNKLNIGSRTAFNAESVILNTPRLTIRPVSSFNSNADIFGNVNFISRNTSLFSSFAQLIADGNKQGAFSGRAIILGESSLLLNSKLFQNPNIQFISNADLFNNARLNIKSNISLNNTAELFNRPRITIKSDTKFLNNSELEKRYGLIFNQISSFQNNADLYTSYSRTIGSNIIMPVDTAIILNPKLTINNRVLYDVQSILNILAGISSNSTVSFKSEAELFAFLADMGVAEIVNFTLYINQQTDATLYIISNINTGFNLELER